ncbi:MAG TPA: hypothetical protein VG033_06270 [Candidatus Acidoferrales bacterium]|nr:hypothetical protein [Candidatus Acidoferrales bacterium]
MRHFAAFCGYTFSMEPPTQVDLTNFSFDEFVSFLFNHDVLPKSKKYDPWYFHVGVEFDAKTICAYYVQLFRQPDFLLSRFTKAQLEEGFWAIQGPNLDCSVSRIIHDSDQPLSIRRECIGSMADLFRRLFAKEPLDSSVQMWWDSLCYDWHCGNRNRESGGEDLELQDMFFQVLAKVLAIDSWVCQGAALHGLGHLHHPHSKELIERYVEEHPVLTQEQKAYALAAARFEVQ